MLFVGTSPLFFFSACAVITSGTFRGVGLADNFLQGILGTSPMYLRRRHTSSQYSALKNRTTVRKDGSRGSV